jgi:hypothetical protein
MYGAFVIDALEYSQSIDNMRLPHNLGSPACTAGQEKRLDRMVYESGLSASDLCDLEGANDLS